VRKVTLFSFLFLVIPVGTVFAQQVDAQFGINGMTAPSASSATGSFAPQSLTGGVYPSVGADVLLKHNFGFNGEVAWKGGRGLYQGFQPYRPILIDFNGVWAPRFNHVGVIAEAGFGAADTRFYQSTVQCTGSIFVTCTNFTSSTHLLGHLGGGLRFYVHGPLYIAPEAHVYFIRNNFEFASAHTTRYGINIGYTFGK
jgi:hypothetical protein